jgi:LDH2 family malate/lactate/ureidoglycolate dehydrogenase
VLVPVEEVRKLAEGILLGNGVPVGQAQTQVNLFLEAEMRAIPSHGLLRLRRVVERIHSGATVPGVTGAREWTARSFLSVDGQRGMGPVVAMAALDAIVPRAREDGIAIAAIRNANHLGALAYYAEYIAGLGLTCIALTVSEALVHPWGGRKAMIGTNPIAIGVPAEPHSMVLDMATGLVSMGKIHDHANRGAPIPLGWALDENGDPTTDAAAAKKGAIAPFGGPKGYALGIAFEVLVSSLAGAAIGTGVKGTLDSVNPCNKGDIFIVIAPPHADAARELVSGYLDDIRAAAPADPEHPVLAPGDRAQKARAQSLAKGMFIDDGLWADLQKLAAESKKEKTA